MRQRKNLRRGRGQGNSFSYDQAPARRALRHAVEALERRLLLNGDPAIAQGPPHVDLTPLNNTGLLSEIDSALGTMQQGLSWDVLGNLPIVGKGLGQAVTFIADVRQHIHNAGEDPGIVQTRLFGWLGPAGANILLDGDDPGLEVTAADIRFVDTADGIEFAIKLGGDIYSTGGAFGFDLGLDGLGLKMNAGVDFTVGWELNLGFGISLTDRFYILSGADAEAQITVIAMLTTGSQIQGTLGFLQLRAADFAEADDIGGGNPTGNTGLFGQIALDLRDPNSDGRMTWTELQDLESPINEKVVGVVNAGADVNLHLTVDFGSDRFPSVSTNFDLDWDFVSADTSGGKATFGGSPAIAFNSVTLDLGTFISNFAGPILEGIQDVTKPIQPILDIITMDLPVISQLA